MTKIDELDYRLAVALQWYGQTPCNLNTPLSRALRRRLCSTTQLRNGRFIHVVANTEGGLELNMYGDGVEVARVYVDPGTGLGVVVGLCLAFLMEFEQREYQVGAKL
jgi:hypothetical protein